MKRQRAQRPVGCQLDSESVRFIAARPFLTGRRWRESATSVDAGGRLLELDLFSHIQRVIDLDSEISNCALQLRVTEENLHGAKVASLAVDQGRLGTTH